MTAPHTIFDPLLGADLALQMLRIRRTFSGAQGGGYGMYSNEGFDTGYAPEIPQRYDSIRNHLRVNADTGEPLSAIAARTNYFRETYAYGEEIAAPGIEPFLHHEGLMVAAAELFGRPVVVPAIVYANILVPGQVLAMHTDVPEFRGANRKIVPQWLLVVMHHSGLFDEWRMPIATAISYFGEGEGGALRFHPDGIDAPPRHVETEHDTGILLDTDSVFHGVERVTGGDEDAVVRLRPGMRLEPAGKTDWVVWGPDGEVARYADHEIRFSVSWKAYCFADEAEHEAWRTHGDDLALDTILDRLDADVRRRGVLDGPRPEPSEFATLLMDTYITFPPA